MFDVQFIDGVTKLSYALEELEHRRDIGEPTYPFGAMLLFQGPGGLDGVVEQYIRESYLELDAFTGTAIIVFVPAGQHSFPTPKQMAGIIEHVKVPLNSLPCLWYFTDPFTENRVSYVPIKEMIPVEADDCEPHHVRDLSETAWGLDHIDDSRERHDVFDGAVFKLAQTATKAREPQAKKSTRIEHATLGVGIVQALIAAVALL